MLMDGAYWLYRKHWDYLTDIVLEMDRRGEVEHAQVFRDTRWRRFPHGPVAPPRC